MNSVCVVIQAEELLQSGYDNAMDYDSSTTTKQFQEPSSASSVS